MEPSEKQCPFCAETIKAEAILCKHCGASLASGPNSAKQPTTTGTPIWIWVVLTPILLLGGLMLIGALSGPPTEKDNARAAIDLCWKGVDDNLASVEARRFVRGACQKMVDKFEAQYGRSSSLRRE